MRNLLLVTEMLMEVVMTYGLRGFECIALGLGLFLIRRLYQRAIRSQVVDGEQLVRRVALRAVGVSTILISDAKELESLVETLVVEEYVPLDMIILQRLLQRRGRVRGDPGKACRGLM